MKTIKVFGIILSGALFTLLGCAAQAEGDRSAKPQSPIQISIQTAQKPVAGQSIQFTVTASSALAAENFAITVHPPKGMKLVDGVLSWNGAIAANEQKQISFTGLLPERGSHNIRATAAIYGKKGGRFAAHSHYRVGPAPVRKSVQRKAPVMRNGQSIIEYPAQ